MYVLHLPLQPLCGFRVTASRTVDEVHMVAQQRGRDNAGHKSLSLPVHPIKGNALVFSLFEYAAEFNNAGGLDVERELQGVVKLAKVAVAGGIGAIKLRIETAEPDVETKESPSKQGE